VKTFNHMKRVIKIESEMEIFDCDGEKLPLVASRSRTSEGQEAIRFSLGNQVFEVSSDVYHYPEVVRELAKMLIEISNNPCTIPEVI